jgi:hypothetical protein
MYRILGSDGNEYDSLSADKIKQWIQEGRVESKTPVMPEGADDWVFLGDLKEFAEVFAAARKLNSSAFTKNRWMKMAGYIGLFLVVAGITVFFIFKKMKYH